VYGHHIIDVLAIALLLQPRYGSNSNTELYKVVLILVSRKVSPTTPIYKVNP